VLVSKLEVNRAPQVDGDVAVDEDALARTIEIIRPAVQADGGDIALAGVEPGGVVRIRFMGACVTCPISTATLKDGVERILRDRVPGVTTVEQAEE
jgi:Fe-S cluster biogenesis protein NfuA